MSSDATDFLSLLSGDGAGPALPSQPDVPDLVPHDTHDMWGGECRRCAISKRWPTIQKRCPVDKDPVRGLMHRDDARNRLLNEVGRFFNWWRAKGHPETLPTLDEWRANYLEWKMGRLSA